MPLITFINHASSLSGTSGQCGLPGLCGQNVRKRPTGREKTVMRSTIHGMSADCATSGAVSEEERRATLFMFIPGESYTEAFGESETEKH